MAIIDGDNYTQLTFLNVTEILRVDGAVVTSGGGDVVGPGSSTINAISKWGDGTGGSLLDSGLLIDANNNLSFTLAGGETEVGIDWDADITMKVVPGSNELASIASNGHGLHFRAWDNTDVSDSNEGFIVSLQSGVLNLEGTAYDGGGIATGEARIDIDVSVSSGPIRITDTVFTKGMVYVADYSTNFTDRSIVDKAYVDGAAGGITGPGTSTTNGIPRWEDTAGDSLLDSGVVIDANNSLLQPTAVANSEVIFGQLDNFQMRTNSAVNATLFEAFNEHDIEMEAYDTDSTDFAEKCGFDMFHDSLTLHADVGDAGGGVTTTVNIKLQQDATDPIVITDGNFVGMKYDGNYANNYTNRSLVDKEYVDTTTEGVIGVSFVMGGAQIVTISDAEIAIADSLYIIKDADGDASSDPVTIKTESTQTIDGSTDDVFIVADHGCVRLVSDGTNLFSW